MPRIIDPYTTPAELVLGTTLSKNVPEADQERQRAEVEEILRRLRRQPGVILADEVGMGKTYVALAAAYSIAVHNPCGPVVVMVPPNLIEKWAQDLKTFCELYLLNRRAMLKDKATHKELVADGAVRYGTARDSVEFMKLLDDPFDERCHLIFLAQGAMARRQTDKWVRLALIAEALRVHGRGRAQRLIQVKKAIHRFLARLIHTLGEERAQNLGDTLWLELLGTDPTAWKKIYNEAVHNEEWRLTDDPVPKAVARALNRVDLKPLAEALEGMPVRTSADEGRLEERLSAVRQALKEIEQPLWEAVLVEARWRSPLLVMDEAHHLKNPGTSLSRQLQSPESDQDLRTGDGAMAQVFNRMLFLTATPFQLGHHELVNVLKRFGDVRWNEEELGERTTFDKTMEELHDRLDESQRAAIGLQQGWSRVRFEGNGLESEVQAWWKGLRSALPESLAPSQKAVRDGFETAKRYREAAEEVLRPWILRENKGMRWAGTEILRRHRLDGAAICSDQGRGGIQIPSAQLLPFFLAARSAVKAEKDLLGEALCSSYEAFRLTRQNQAAEKDEQEAPPEPTPVDLTQSAWYLGEFDRALARSAGSMHPKINATVRKATDLWEAGEKVLVFAFYRHTCKALRLHISQEIERRVMLAAEARLRAAQVETAGLDVQKLLDRVQQRYFDDAHSPGRSALDAALKEILHSWRQTSETAQEALEERNDLIDVMRRFLRVSTTLVRCFPLAELDTLSPPEAVRRVLDHVDNSGSSWRSKFHDFIDYLTNRCSTEECRAYLEAASRIQTGGVRVDSGEEDDDDEPGGTITLANVKMATGQTKRERRERLMRAFNTPFFPDILVCSQVMGEGVDLQRFCRHVIHHDLDWNPSSIEQRTGRIDRLGCKAEGRHPISVYLPYLAGTADERQYRVMSDRERWFRVVMGQDEVARLITPNANDAPPLPEAVSEELAFKLGLKGRALISPS
jgi:superfamily II DNA or RNA helicase